VLNIIRVPTAGSVPPGSGSTFAFTGVAPGGNAVQIAAEPLDRAANGLFLPLLGVTAGEDGKRRPDFTFNDSRP